MRLIILDHLRRWWWVWLISIMANSVLVLVISACDYKFRAIFPLGMFMGALLLSFDLQRGHARAIIMTPVTAKQVARAWWWLAVGLPVVVTVTTTLFLFSAYASWHDDWSRLSSCAAFCVSNFLTLATMFFAFTGLPQAVAGCDNWKDRVRECFFVGVWGISFAGWLAFQSADLAPASVLGLLLAAVCLAILGWFRAESLVRERTSSPAASPASRHERNSPSHATGGYGGSAFLAQNIFARQAFMGVALFSVLDVILPLINHFEFNSFSTDSMGEAFPIFAFQFLWIMSFQIIPFATHIRYLRTLPISTTKLAAMLVFSTLVAMIVILYGATLLLSAVFQTPLPGPEKIIQRGAIWQIAIATAAVPLTIWRPMEGLTFLIMIVLMWGGMIASFFKYSLPAGISVTASLLIVLGVFMATKMLLERSSRTYRPRTLQFGGLNWGTRR